MGLNEGLGSMRSLDGELAGALPSPWKVGKIIKWNISSFRGDESLYLCRNPWNLVNSMFWSKYNVVLFLC